MANGKKSVLLYCDIIHTVEELTDEEAGKLFKHYLRYINDLNPETPDKLTKIVFEPIKQNLKRDLVKWEQYIDKQRENGRKGGRPSDIKETQITQAFFEEPKKAVKVKVTVKDKVTDIVKESNTFTPTDLSKSNLFRSPTIPTAEEVNQAFLSSGGNLEMAKIFFDKNSAVGWFLKGSPITNFRNLLPSFISNFKMNEQNGKSVTSNNGLGPKSGGFGILADIINPDRRK